MQFFTFLNMILVGIIIAVIFDFYRVLIAEFKFSIYLISLFDFLSFLLFASIAFYRLIRINGGQLRWYVFLGIISGVFFYYLTISTSVIIILNKIIDFIIKIYLKLKNTVN
ncbi:MAG: spore cortex biosynthesis protein YabQ [Bacillota bacterium]